MPINYYAKVMGIASLHPSYAAPISTISRSEIRLLHLRILRERCRGA